jgi:hypothetical protein
VGSLLRAQYAVCLDCEAKEGRRVAMRWCTAGKGRTIYIHQMIAGKNKMSRLCSSGLEDSLRRVIG